MRFALTLFSHPAVAYAAIVTAMAACIYAAHTRSLWPALAAVAAAASATLALLAAPPHGMGLALVALGAALLQAEFLLPTYGAAFLAGFASSVGGSWLLLTSADSGAGVLETPARVALALTGTFALLAGVWRGSRKSTLPRR